MIRNAIPNLFTLGNLACGVLGIVAIFENQWITVSYLIWIAAALDFFDGFVARALKATSELGKQLDSLSDLVTFGVLPSLLYFQMLRETPGEPFHYLALLVALCSALRLAKFNIDKNQQENFVGLTTTANGILASTIPLILHKEQFLAPLFNHSIGLPVFVVLFSLFLVAPVTLFSFKFSNFKWKGNEHRYVLILVSILLILFIQESAVLLIIGVYLILSLMHSFASKKNKKLRG